MTHGYRHDWVMVGDYVTHRNRKTITVFRRVEKCDENGCERERSQLIDAVRWEAITAKTYTGKVVPMADRTSKEKDLEEYYRSTTNLEDLK